jgi:hypothetical protein
MLTPELEKWLWKMNYCKLHRLPPAQSWAWDYVEKKWGEIHDTRT